jgi:hypothetical protein
MKNRSAKLSVAAVLLFAFHAAVAGSLHGIVKDNGGQALEGVMIRLSDPISGISESVFSNANGEYVLTTALQGELTLRLSTWLTGLPYIENFRWKS